MKLYNLRTDVSDSEIYLNKESLFAIYNFN